MQNRSLIAAAIAASALLAGCNSQPETVTGGNRADPTAREVAAAPPVQLPPSVKESKIYRCKDNSVVYIDYLSDGLGANYRAGKEDLPVRLTAPAAGEAFVSEGYSLTGTGDTVTIARPGKPGQSCKA